MPKSLGTIGLTGFQTGLVDFRAIQTIFCKTDIIDSILPPRVEAIDIMSTFYMDSA
jgi:hypothetical protein